MTQVAAYLERIGHAGPRAATAETLRALHRAHLLRVPFENLDITLGVRIELVPERLLAKVVERRRGGFCYELNEAFAWLLRELGFGVTRLAARVANDSPAGYGPEFDHMLLRVDVEPGGRPWICDVGFGDSFVEPFPMTTEEHVEGRRSYRLVGTPEGTVLEQRADAGWTPEFRFTDTPRRLAEFEAMCAHQQTSPESSFTRKSICSRATPAGRVTLSDGRWIVTAGGQREERAVADEAELARLLDEQFGIDLGAGADVARLLRPPGSP